MSTLRLMVTISRPRATLTLLIFLLAGAVWHGAAAVTGPLALAGVALAAAYAASSCLNQLADRRIDSINLPGLSDRPLVAGTAGPREMIGMAVAAAAVAIAAGFAASLFTGILISGALILYGQYSLPPLRISHRPYLTPPCLAVGYSVIPFAAGADAAGARLGAADAWIMAALFTLFLARILLKDLRDRKGDAACGKATIVLRHGKRVVSGLSTGTLVAGMGLLAVALAGRPVVLAAMLPFAAALLFVEVRLASATRILDEVILVGLGARIGNGMILALVGMVTLMNVGADIATVAVAGLLVMAPYAYTLREYVLAPSSFRFGPLHLEASEHNGDQARPRAGADEPPAPSISHVA
ncbi:MAG: UbiA family prenyltransferase [Candidatus Dormibacteria bacterium]|jgi:4-hydroxybenzoate polyprenyltransferase